MFGKSKRTIKIGDKVIELESKPGATMSLASSLRGIFSKKGGKPQGQAEGQQGEKQVNIYRRPTLPQAPRVETQPQVQPSQFRMFIENIGARHKGLETSLKQQKMKETIYEFIKKMLIASSILSVMLAVTLVLLFKTVGLPLSTSILFGLLLGVAIFYMAFETFLRFPMKKSESTGKTIERDILFAARDMIISLRSGMPLFNAITSISSGYGDASKEFAKIVELVQLGTPLEDAIDQVVAKTKSPSFRRLMLQAAVSIKAGADVVSALQSVIDQLSKERVIELRRYGQRLNAIAMFYMLFGIILPSMGIAVITILTTFIALFTVTDSVLEFAIVMMFFLQVIFLQLIRGSRPVFTM